MNENSKNTKYEPLTFFSENISQNSKTAHSNMQECLKLLSHGQELIDESVYSIDFLFDLIKQIFNGEYTREEALDILGEEYTMHLNFKVNIKDYNNKISDFIEHFEF